MKFLKRPALNLIALVLLVCILTACFKNTIETTGNESSSLEQLADDELSVDAAIDDMWDDMNGFLDDGGFKSSISLPCNVTDSVKTTGDTVYHTLHYNGINCTGTRFRSGLVIMMHDKVQKWSDQGAKVIVTFKNFKMTRLSTSKSITLNGKNNFENTYGGRLSDIGNGNITQVIQKAIGTISVTFDNNTIQTWEMARQRAFNGTNGNRLIYTSGFGSDNGTNYLVFWGSNRSGNPFLSQIVSVITYKQACSGYPCSGTKILQLSGAKNNGISYGYNDDNKPVSGSECPTKIKLEIKAISYTGTIYIKL